MAFGPNQGVSFPLKDNSTIENSNFSSENYQVFGDFVTKHKTGLLNVPEFVMDMYHTYTEDDGTLKGNKMPASIHYFIGQGRVFLALWV